MHKNYLALVTGYPTVLLKSFPGDLFVCICLAALSKSLGKRTDITSSVLRVKS